MSLSAAERIAAGLLLAAVTAIAVTPAALATTAATGVRDAGRATRTPKEDPT